MKRYIIIGDIHGCLDELIELIHKTRWNPAEDRLILAGDLVDRGPKSAEVIQWARTNNIEVVRGNHDDRYVQFSNKLENKKKPKWIKNYPDRLAIFQKLTPEDIQFLKSTPTYIKISEIKTYIIHGGIIPGRKIEDQESNSLMHVRFLYDNGNCYSKAPLDAQNGYCQPRNSFFWAEKYDGKWDIVYGHHVWDLKEIKTHENNFGAKCYGIDTGVCFGGHLTAMIIEPGKPHEIVQIEAKKKKV